MNQITYMEAQSLAESFINFIADDPLGLRKTPGLADSTMRTYRWVDWRSDVGGVCSMAGGSSDCVFHDGAVMSGRMRL